VYRSDGRFLPFAAALVEYPDQVNGVVLPLLMRFDDLQHPPEPKRDDYGNIISEVCNIRP
jgi:hypothetical protein